MANTCITSYIITGSADDISALSNISTLKKIIEDSPKEKDKHGEPLKLVRDIITALGGHPSSRGEWTNLKTDRTYTEVELHITTETAWSRPEDLEEAIRHRFPDLEVWFLEEELGCDIFRTNDNEGTHFKETIIIDEEDDGIEYYTEEEAMKRISELAGHPIKTWEEAEAAAAAINETQDENNRTGHIQLHKAETI